MLKKNQTKLLDRLLGLYILNNLMSEFQLYLILLDIERKFGEMTAQFESKQEEVDQTRRELSETKEMYSKQNEQLKLLEITLKGMFDVFVVMNEKNDCLNICILLLQNTVTQILFFSTKLLCFIKGVIIYIACLNKNCIFNWTYMLCYF